MAMPWTLGASSSSSWTVREGFAALTTRHTIRKPTSPRHRPRYVTRTVLDERAGICPTDSSNVTSASNSVHPSSNTVSSLYRTIPLERL